MAGLRGMAEPEEIAALFSFLASDEARSVTGAIYTIDNGITISWGRPRRCGGRRRPLPCDASRKPTDGEERVMAATEPDGSRRRR